MNKNSPVNYKIRFNLVLQALHFFRFHIYLVVSMRFSAAMYMYQWSIRAYVCRYTIPLELALSAVCQASEHLRKCMKRNIDHPRRLDLRQHRNKYGIIGIPLTFALTMYKCFQTLHWYFLSSPNV